LRALGKHTKALCLVLTGGFGFQVPCEWNAKPQNREAVEQATEPVKAVGQGIALIPMKQITNFQKITTLKFLRKCSNAFQNHTPSERGMISTSSPSFQ